MQSSFRTNTKRSSGHKNADLHRHSGRIADRQWGKGEALISFLKDEDGAITVDWVVITAAIVGLQIVLMVGLIRDSLVGASAGIANTANEYSDFIQ